MAAPTTQSVPLKGKENKTKVEEKKMDNKVEEIKEEKVEKKMDDKKIETETKKKEEKKIVKTKEVLKKDVAVANGFSLRISPKQSKYVMRIIRGKSPSAAVARLQAVLDEKRPVPMAGLEVGHKKGKGLAGGKWPKNACKGIMEIVKQAGANAVVAGIEAPVIPIAKADRAAAPLKKGGRKAKRAHIHIEITEKVKLVERESKRKAKLARKKK